MRTLLALSSVLALSASASAQVTHWRMVKGPSVEQTADDTQPTLPTGWSVGVYVRTQSPGDAAAVSISGGGILGSIPLTLEGDTWVLEADFGGQGSMNKVFPSATQYTLGLTGGTLGTLFQPLVLGPEQYPNPPFLTGSTWSDVQSHDPAAPFTLTWNNPGPLTQASGVSVLEIFDGSDASILSQIAVGGTTAGIIPGCTLAPNQSYEGFLEFTNANNIDGSTGFGVDGTTSHNVGLDFTIATNAAAAVEVIRAGTPANPIAFLPGTTGPVIGSDWDPVVDHTTFVPDAIADFVAVSMAPSNIPSPVGTFLCGLTPFLVVPSPAPGARFAIEIPNDCSYVGGTLSTQAGSLDLFFGVQLANAIDVTIGML